VGRIPTRNRGERGQLVVLVEGAVEVLEGGSRPVVGASERSKRRATGEHLGHARDGADVPIPDALERDERRAVLEHARQGWRGQAREHETRAVELLERRVARKPARGVSRLELLQH